MTIAIDTPTNFTRVARGGSFDPERWRRGYGHRARQSRPASRSTFDLSVAPRRPFAYSEASRATEGGAAAGSQSPTLATLLIAALMTALVIVGLALVAEVSSGSGGPSGHPIAAIAAGADGDR